MQIGKSEDKPPCDYIDPQLFHKNYPAIVTDVSGMILECEYIDAPLQWMIGRRVCVSHSCKIEYSIGDIVSIGFIANTRCRLTGLPIRKSYIIE